MRTYAEHLKDDPKCDCHGCVLDYLFREMVWPDMLQTFETNKPLSYNWSKLFAKPSKALEE